MNEKLKRNIQLLFDSPRDFIFSHFYSETEKVYLKKYNPKAKIAAENLILKLKKITPETKVYLVGSTGLEIDGTGDIDIFATTKENLHKIAKKYLPLIGKPSKIRLDFIRWDFLYMGAPVELFLNHPDNKHFQEQLKLYKLLKENPKHLKEYNELKKKINGTSVKEYIRERMSFFNKLIKESK